MGQSSVTRILNAVEGVKVMFAIERFRRAANSGFAGELRMPHLRVSQPRALAKWCTCALVLLLPSSFIVLPLLWLTRHWALRSARPEILAAGVIRPKLARCTIICKRSVIHP